jgi:FKBP-type peptidyl-prolyl cis-trans isomerase FkpA
VVQKSAVIIGSVVLIALVVGLVLYLGGSAAKPAAAQATATPATSSTAGLVSTDEVVGTGAEATVGSTVSVSYTGTLDNGTVFDSTAKDGGTPFSFQLGAGQVIKGWDTGVVGMKVGGTRKLVIPPSLGYGSQAAGSIPPNSTLTFVIQLLSVK